MSPSTGTLSARGGTNNIETGSEVMNKRKILSTTALALCFGVAGVGYTLALVGV